MKRYLLTFLTLTFLLNAVLSGFSATTNSHNKNNFSELSKLLGDKVFICTGNNSKKFYVSTFERLDQEQKQKLKKHIDIASSAPASDSQYINNTHSFYITALHKGAITPYPTALKFEGLSSFHKSSRAPPLHS